MESTTAPAVLESTTAPSHERRSTGAYAAKSIASLNRNARANVGETV
jgi:hypothetical protein